MGFGNMDDRRVLRSDGGCAFRTNFLQDDSPMYAIVRAISALEGCDERELRPLHEYVDLSSLDRLLTTAHESKQAITVEIDIDAYTVLIRSDGVLTVHESDAPEQLHGDV